MSWRMNALKTTLRAMINYFFGLTTLILIIRGGVAWLTGSELMRYDRDLLAIPLMALFGVLPMLISVPFVIKSLRGLIIIRVVHFILTAIFVFVPQMLWIRLRGTEIGIIPVMVIFLIIYAALSVRTVISEARLAKKLNARLDALMNE